MTDPAKDIGEDVEALLVDLRADFGEHLFFTDEARRLLSAHDAGIWEAAAKATVERCLAVVHREEDATNAAKEFATGKFFEEVLIAQKVLRSVAEKIAALRALGKGEKR